jgi:hypothetical protein
MRRCGLTLVAAVVVAAIGLLVLPAPAGAHHSPSTFFDMTKTVEIQGVVTKWEFRNPHPILHVEVTDQNGTNTWLLQFHNVTTMTRRGVTAETFLPGTVIKAMGAPSRVPGTYGMNANVVVMPDGREIKEGAGGATLNIPGVTNPY